MTATCCPAAIWICLLCAARTCGDHDPSPNEVRLLCERCVPIDYEENE